jgi:DNA-binding CsgD family transcriptional regulator
MTAGTEGGVDLTAPLGEALSGRSCAHLAILLRSLDEVPAAQASFYAVGVRRNGWVLHHTLPGRAGEERAALTAAGLDVAALEREGRMLVEEWAIAEPPETWAQRFVAVAQKALARGFDAVWWTGYPVGPDDELYGTLVEYDRAWEACIHGRPSVSMCLYVAEGLPAPERERREAQLGAFHDALLVPAASGIRVVLREAPTTDLVEAMLPQPASGPPPAAADLSARELEVLSLMGEGLRNREIAERLIITEATVKTHVRHVLEKLRMRNRAEAAAFAAKYLT